MLPKRRSNTEMSTGYETLLSSVSKLPNVDARTLQSLSTQS